MSIELKELNDLSIINQIMTNEFVMDDISDDYSKGFSFESLPENINFYGVYKNNECVGFFATHLQNSITVEIHTTLLPSCRGSDAIKAGRLIVDLLLNTFHKIISWISVDNKKALIYSKLMGFKVEGESRCSIMKKGILYNQYLVGITRGDLKCL